MYSFVFFLIVASTCQGQRSGGSILEAYAQLKDIQAKPKITKSPVSRKRQRVSSDDDSSDEEYVDRKLSPREISEINKQNKQKTANALKARLQSKSS